MAKRRKSTISLVQLPVDEEHILSMARQIIEARFKPRPNLTSAVEAKEYLILSMATEPRELFGILYLNNAHAVLGFEILFKGTIDSAAVHSREVVEHTLKNKAAAVILVHNHPSGETKPSRADIALTGRLAVALDTIDVRVIDHIIVAGTQTVSMAELDIMPNKTTAKTA